MAETIHSYALCTLAQVKTTLGITDSANDDILTRLINATTDYIESYCDRRFALTQYTDEYYNGYGDDELVLRQFPISEAEEDVPTISFIDKGTETAVSIDDCEIYYDEGIIYYSIFPKGRKNIKISYKAGYATIPADLAQACIEIVVANYNRSKTVAVKSESIGSYSVTYADVQASPHAKGILNLYRNPNL